MNTPNELLVRFSAGELVIVLDEHREVEGDFFVLAETITTDQMNFLYQRARGLICVACAPEILDRLRIPQMVERPEDDFSTNFAVSVDAAAGITTGVSKFDRIKTVRLLASSTSQSTDLVRPGHTFPLRAQNPNERFGHTECAVELAKKCGKIPAVVICEILNDNGEKATRSELQTLANEIGCAFGTREKLRNFLV